MKQASSRKHWLTFVLLAAAIVAAGAAAWWWLDRSGPKRAAAPPPVPVAVEAVQSGDVPVELQELGQVTAINTVTVRTQVAGQVQRIAFRDGQEVAEGDLLAQVDPRPLQAVVDQDKGNLDKDRASLANAETDLRRFVPLLAKGVVSQQQVDTQRSLVAQLRGTVAADTAALSRDRVQLTYATIRAPLAGVLGLRQVDVGNLVGPGDPGGIVVLTQLQPIAVLFTAAQRQLLDIRDKQAAAGVAGLRVEVWSQDGSRKLDEGRLEAVSNVVSATSGTLTLKGVFPNAQRLLWPGAFVGARLVLDVQRNGLTVPVAAIEQGPKGPFAWVVGADGTAHVAQVAVRQIASGRALVTSGLQAGQQVVTDGQYGLSDGAHVSTGTQQADAGSPLRNNGSGRLGIAP